MSVILVSDVFGLTAGLIELGKELHANIIVDPYEGIDMDFGSEAEAYSYFRKHVGVENYYLELLEVTLHAPLASTLIGFSVGATVVWRLSGNSKVNSVSCAICYYGSQIRNFKMVNPLFEVALIFPVNEPHFDVLELQNVLSAKSNVSIHKRTMSHGFMNLHSDNFDRAAYERQLKWLNLNMS